MILHNIQILSRLLSRHLCLWQQHVLTVAPEQWPNTMKRQGRSLLSDSLFCFTVYCVAVNRRQLQHAKNAVHRDSVITTKAKKFSTHLTQLTYNQLHCTQVILFLILQSLHHCLFCFTKQKHRQIVTHSATCSYSRFTILRRCVKGVFKSLYFDSSELGTRGGSG
jgi:hypothetical protein